MSFNWFPVFLVCAPLVLRADFTLSKNGKPACVIVQQAGATEAEKFALRELTNSLHQITGADFEVSDAIPKAGEHAIIVGPGPAAAARFPDIGFAKLGAEECVMRVRAGNLLLAG